MRWEEWVIEFDFEYIHISFNIYQRAEKTYINLMKIKILNKYMLKKHFNNILWMYNYSQYKDVNDN